MTQSTRTKAQAAKLEAKAIASATKSEGMRTLYEAGYSVAQVSKIFGVGYAFAYGVAKRAGLQLQAAARRPIKTITKAKVAKVIARPTEAKAARVKTAARVAKVAAKTVTTKPAKRVTDARTSRKVAVAAK